LRALALGLLLSWLAPGAGAQTMESVLAPGKLIQGHAKVEEDCAACHVRFDRPAQDKRCAECHKDIGADLRDKLGFHGRMKPQACRTCHTEHKGRDAHIAEFDKRQFDHALTDYALRGKHRSTDCAKCHEPAKKFREAASDCNSCHKKDDTHKGSLGPKCANCHTENSWKEAKFDHATTRFALTGKHVDAACGDCHKNKADYKDTPRACYGCHRKDDDSAKGHKGQYGERCDSCHGTKAWKPSTFNHDTDTRYALRGKHRGPPCTGCHTGNLYKVKLAQECVSCHKKDDKHKGTLGTDCAACHTEADWKGKSRFDHARTAFPLLGKHADIRCDACHQSTMFKEAPKACIGCHQKDDKHVGTLGERCESCHNERLWKDTRGRFDHDRTQFRLRNAHAAPKVECKACHQDLKSFRKTPLDCYSCHKKDDKHEGQLGRDCVKCHDDKTWKLGNFNHTRTRFALVGRHITVACTACHVTSRFKDAPRECVGCHNKDDKHKRAYGDDCASCHNARAWSIWDFDHNRRSSYKLDGAHRQVACEACHQRPAPEGQRIAALPGNCVFCHRKDDAHDGAFGIVCEQCHVAENWKKVSPRANRRGAAAANGGRPLAALFGESSRLSGPGGPVSPALK
jgi:hypothetical protein